MLGYNLAAMRLLQQNLESAEEAAFFPGTLASRKARIPPLPGSVTAEGRRKTISREETSCKRRRGGLAGDSGAPDVASLP